MPKKERWSKGEKRFAFEDRVRRAESSTTSAFLRTNQNKKHRRKISTAPSVIPVGAGSPQLSFTSQRAHRCTTLNNSTKMYMSILISPLCVMLLIRPPEAKSKKKNEMKQRRNLTLPVEVYPVYKKEKKHTCLSLFKIPSTSLRIFFAKIATRCLIWLTGGC